MPQLTSREFIIQHLLEGKNYQDICNEYAVEKQQLQEWWKQEVPLRNLIKKSNQLFSSRKNNLTFTKFETKGRKEFFKWFERQKRECAYCGIEEYKLEALYHIENGPLRNKRHRGRTLELERRDSDTNQYSPKNCVLACYMCNNHKSDVITEKEHKFFFAPKIYEFLESKYLEIAPSEGEKKVKQPQVYFSEILKTEYNEDWEKIEAILTRNNISFQLLKGTKDIWCRDYMPVKGIQFRYEPSYLKGNEHLQSEPKSVLIENGIEAKYSSLNIDGGNVETIDDVTILSKRIFDENPTIEKEDLIVELSQLLETKIYLMRDYHVSTDFTGHIDGYLRIVENGKLIVNELENDFDYMKKGFAALINSLQWDYVEMPWFKYASKDNPKDSATGVYTNYLVIDDIVIFPIFGVEGNRDAEAIEIIQSVYPDKKIETVKIDGIAKKGGLMNCISWVK